MRHCQLCYEQVLCSMYLQCKGFHPDSTSKYNCSISFSICTQLSLKRQITLTHRPQADYSVISTLPIHRKKHRRIWLCCHQHHSILVPTLVLMPCNFTFKQFLKWLIVERFGISLLRQVTKPSILCNAFLSSGIGISNMF